MHTLITGTTMSGKSVLAKKFARAHSLKGHAVIVHDPLISDDWGDYAIVCGDEYEFFEQVREIVREKTGAAIFVDEADIVLSHSQKENHWLLTRGRHYGLKVYVITQRPKMVAPTVRNQCTEAYAFLLSEDDAKSVGGDYAVKLDECTEHAQGICTFVYWKEENGKRKRATKRLDIFDRR